MKIFTKTLSLFLLGTSLSGCVSNQNSVYIETSTLRESKCHIGPSNIWFGYAKSINIKLSSSRNQSSTLFIVSSAGDLAPSFLHDNKLRLIIIDQQGRRSNIDLSAQWHNVSLDDMKATKKVDMFGIEMVQPEYFKSRVPYLLSWSQLHQLANAKSIDFILESKIGDIKGNMDDSTSLFKNFIDGCKSK